LRFCFLVFFFFFFVFGYLSIYLCLSLGMYHYLINKLIRGLAERRGEGGFCDRLSVYFYGLRFYGSIVYLSIYLGLEWNEKKEGK